MRKLAVALALVVALVIAATAYAGDPFRFSDRAAFEKYIAHVHLALPGLKRGSYTVKGVGCTKIGIGRAYCVLVTQSPSQGVRSFLVRVTCPSDAGIGCRYNATALD